MIYNIVTFLNTIMTVTTNETGQQNAFAKEPQIEVMDQDYAVEAERANGRWAMIGFWAAVGSYAVTGQVIPGIF